MHRQPRRSHPRSIVRDDSAVRDDGVAVERRQANIDRPRFLSAFLPAPYLALLAGLALLVGCAQSDTGEYTEYVSETETSSADAGTSRADESVARDSAAAEAEIATAAVDAKSDTTTEAGTSELIQTPDGSAGDTAAVTSSANAAETQTAPAEVVDIAPAEASAVTPVTPTVTPSANTAAVPAPPLPTAVPVDAAGREASTADGVLQVAATIPRLGPAGLSGTEVGTDASPATTTPSAAPAGPRKVELLVKDRKFQTEGPDGALRVSFDDFDLLKILNMDPVTADAPKLLPDWLRALDGKRVRVRGFMYPPFEETGLRGFVLARDNQICCFGRNPKVYDLVEVTMRKGVTANYIQNRPFDVVGIFRIEPSVLDDELFGLYKLEDAIVIDD